MILMTLHFLLIFRNWVLIEQQLNLILLTVRSVSFLIYITGYLTGSNFNIVLDSVIISLRFIQQFYHKIKVQFLPPAGWQQPSHIIKLCNKFESLFSDLQHSNSRWGWSTAANSRPSSLALSLWWSKWGWRRNGLLLRLPAARLRPQQLAPPTEAGLQSR